ncbi:Uncharacterised protein [Mycobacteroides abscessus subsp. abscessus]|nr:Uncharacterised protein [Mycobacteroides abscessus subsp. abscessus]
MTSSMLERMNLAMTASGVAASASDGRIVCCHVPHEATGSSLQSTAKYLIRSGARMKLGTEMPMMATIMLA